MIADKKAE